MLPGKESAELEIGAQVQFPLRVNFCFMLLNVTLFYIILADLTEYFHDVFHDVKVV